MTPTGRAPSRLRVIALTAIFSAATFFVQAAPATLPVPRPEALRPAVANANTCTSAPQFTGHITSSASSTSVLAETVSGDVFGYISNVDAAWNCTTGIRYSGVTWNTEATLGTFDYGRLINGATLACNWDVSSTDYLKANASTNCPAADADYPLEIQLDTEQVYHNNAAHTAAGHFSYVHSDCTTHYAMESVTAAPTSYSATNVPNRPGPNCDPIVLDNTSTGQNLVYDHTPPTPGATGQGTSGITIGAGNPAWVTSGTVTLYLNATDALAGMSQMRFSNDGTTWGGWINYASTASWTLSIGNGTKTVYAQFNDQNGNATTATGISDAVGLDGTPPQTDFTAPDEGTTTTINTTSYAPAWIETEANSGIATRSLQRQRVAATSAACPGTFLNDGSATSSVSGTAVTLAFGFCYQWIQTLTDGASNQTSKLSGKVFVDGASPTTTFTSPIVGTTTNQATTTYSVAWAENAGAGQTITARSLQRQKVAISAGTCPATGWATDGTPFTGTSPWNPAPGPLVGGQCYRWVQTLTNSAGKTSVTPSGSVLVDTTIPSGSIATPLSNAPLEGDVVITGSATDAHSWKDYVLDYGAGATPSSWTNIGTFTTQIPPTGTLHTWSPPGALSGAYTIRLTVRDNAGNTATFPRTVVLENARRGDERYYTRTPFDLGGEWRLDVGVHNGEARLSRDLYSIPSYGPSQALSLSYSSLETGAAGSFGIGWNSNLTQYLTFDAPDIMVWHRADGGRVPFGKVAGSWVDLAGHYETASIAGSEVTITQKDQTKLVFDSTGAGRLKRIENRFGKQLVLAWNTSSATATDASGRVTNIVIDSANNRITSVTDSALRTWSFGYTGTALISITDSASKVTTLGYTSSLLTSVTRTRSRVSGAPQTITWTVGYTGGKVTGVTAPDAASVANTFTYIAGSTEVGMLKEVAGPVRNTWTYDFDQLGRVTSATDPEGFVTSSTFDATSNVLNVAVPVGDGTTTASTTRTYDSKGNVLTETVPIDASTNVLTVNTYNATNDLLTRSEADNDSAIKVVTKYGYDGSGRLASVNVNCTTTGTTPPSPASSCTGAGTQDAATNLTTAYTYTANHQVENETDPLGRVTRHTYDANGNETSVVQNYVSGQSATNDRNVTTTSAYAANQAGNAGLVTSTTDPVGNTTTFTYDALGRQLIEVLPGDTSIPALTRTTTYDELGNVLTTTEGWTPLGGGAAINRTTNHVYDLANRETSSTDAAGVVATTGYDAAGSAITTTAGGVTTTRAFDGLGRAVTETTDGGDTTRAYDAQGNEIMTHDPVGDEVAREFTFTDWLIKETVDPEGLTLATTHTYDKLGRELITTDPQSVATTRTYDRAGRQLTTSTGGATSTTVYDRAGNAITVKAPDGAVAATLVDPLDRPVTSIVNCTNTGTTAPAAGVACAGTGTVDALTNIQTTTYIDAAGSTIAIKDPKGITGRTIVNLRGLAKQLIANCTDAGTTPTTNPGSCTGAGTANGTTNVKTNTTYDGTGSPTGSVVAVGTGAEATTETAYDAAGRAQAVKDPRGTISRSFFNGNGQLTKTVVNCTTTGTTVPPDWINCTGAGTQDGTYNLTTMYTYDARGNQASVTAPNGRLTTMVYDQNDRLFQRIDNDVAGTPGANEDVTTTYYYDDAGRQVAVRAPTANGTSLAVTRYVYNVDGTLQSEIRGCTDTGTSVPANPATCTGDGTADASTNITISYTYDSKGNRISMTAANPAATTGTAIATVITQYAYDAGNRLCRVVENATGTTNVQALTNPCSDATQTAGTSSTNVSTRYTYDPAGNLASMVDGAGSVTAYGYDKNGRMTSITDPLGETLVWAYDEVGNRIRQENRADSPLTPSVMWTYDGAGRILTRLADGVTTEYDYDDNGNKIQATTGSLEINVTYDRLNRVLTVDDEDAGTTADTTYTYSLTSPSWTDPTGSYSATLDKFDRPLSVNDPVNATDFTWTYRADGQPATMAQPNGNTTTFGYDVLGHLTSKDTAAGGTDRALYAWTHNRAGQILSEASTITGDPSNGTLNYAYDPLGRLTGSTVASTSTTTAYGWDKVPNRTSVQVGAGTPATTTYNAANRPTAGSNPTATYTNDDDGRLTAAPGYRYEWDHLGRPTKVRPPTGGTVIATYSYDPLDRLRLVDYGSNDRTRFRYVGLTTAVAQLIDDQSGTVTRHVANGWTGERLADWTAGGANLRIYGTNGHHDTTWLASSTGAVSQALRYDPWGNPRASVPTGYTPFRFQGSWFDEETELSWVVTRWYAPSLGRFISEDTLLGEPREPDSRHLYAYAEGEPVGRWDPDGRNACALTLVGFATGIGLPASVAGFIACNAVQIVVGAGFIGAAALAGWWVRTHVVQVNRGATLAERRIWHERVANGIRRLWQQRGWMVRTEVVFHTPLGDRREDVCMYRWIESANPRIPGPRFCIEVKTGAAKYPFDQFAKDFWLSCCRRLPERPFPTLVWFGPAAWG